MLGKRGPLRDKPSQIGGKRRGFIRGVGVLGRFLCGGYVAGNIAF